MSLIPPTRGIRLPLRLQPQGGRHRSTTSSRDEEDGSGPGPGPSTAANRSSRQLTEIGKTTCGICRKYKSKYVCPRCNVFYCSLECFRDQKHDGCSEPFYAASVRQALEGAPDLTSEKKRRALETLQRFEAAPDDASRWTGDGGDDLKALLGGLRDENGVWNQERADALERALGFDIRALESLVAGQEEDQGDGSDADDELRRALDGLDLDTMDADELLRRLPSKYRRDFMTLIEHPDSLDARQLLKQIEPELIDTQTIQAPWWQDRDDELGWGSGETSSPAPTPLSDTELGGIAVKEKVAIGLLRNAMAIGLSYIALTRHHAVDSLTSASTPTALLILDDLMHCLPFLFDSQSTTAYASVRDVLGDLASRLPDDHPHPQEKETIESPAAGLSHPGAISSSDLTIIARLTRPTIELDASTGLERVVADLWRFVQRLRKRQSQSSSSSRRGDDGRGQKVKAPQAKAGKRLSEEDECVVKATHEFGASESDAQSAQSQQEIVNEESQNPRTSSSSSSSPAHQTRLLRAAERKLLFYAGALKTLRSGTGSGDGRKALRDLVQELEQAAGTGGTVMDESEA